MLWSRFPQFFHGYLSGTQWFLLGQSVVPILPKCGCLPHVARTPQAIKESLFEDDRQPLGSDPDVDEVAMAHGDLNNICGGG